MTARLKFDIQSFWCAATGRGGGALFDESAHKDAHGLPCLPGRTVKGLVRDAVYRAEQWDLIPKHSTRLWFGSHALRDGRPQGLVTEPGALRFSDAQLAPELRDYLLDLRQMDPLRFSELRRGFFHPLFATAINEKSGAALDKSLRSIEVTIPLELHSDITLGRDCEESPHWREDLGKCLCLIRSLGTARSRGLGRVVVTLEDGDAG